MRKGDNISRLCTFVHKCKKRKCGATRERSTTAGKIVQATLDAVITYGIHAVTHRKIATIAQVPLGSMTYYFSGIDELLMEAFGHFTETMSRQYQAFLWT